MGLFSKKKRLVSIYAEDSGVKLLELNKSGKSYEVVGLSVIKPQAGPAGIEDMDAATLKVISEKNFWEGTKKPVVAAGALSVDKVLIRNMFLPVMPEKELADAVKFESRDLFPISANELVIDYAVVGKGKDEGTAKMEILVVAARKTHVQKLASAIRFIGLEPAVIDIEPMALARVKKLCDPDSGSNGCYAILNIEGARTSISLYIGETPRFTRVLPTGINRITRLVAAAQEISPEEAEQALARLDLSAAGSEEIRPAVQEMAAETRKTLDYFRNQQKNTNIEKVYLTGSRSMLKGLDSVMTAELDVPVSILNPFASLKLSPRLQDRADELMATGAAYSVAVGLALSEV